MMVDIEEDIVEWHQRTFPNATAQAIILKLREELHEAIVDAIHGNLQSLLEEIADCFIVACSLAARRDLFEHNVSMTRVIRDKMKVNKARVWGPETENGDRKRVKQVHG